MIDWEKWRRGERRGEAETVVNGWWEPLLNPGLDNTAIVLGAGFSIAISGAMPDTDGLGEAVRSRLAPEYREKLPETFIDGGFEEWVSYLAEEQPHLSPSGNFEAHALMYEVTKAIEEVLKGRQLRALEEWPPWLFKFLSVAHVDRMNVLTMNYDCLVECGVASHYLPGPMRYEWQPSSQRQEMVSGPVGENDILRGVPAGVEDVWQLEPYRATLRLLKLHGSLSWYAVPGDTSGSTLARWKLPGTFGKPVEEDQELRSTKLPGRAAFIVPPAAIKSEYLRNPVVRQVWAWAFEALQQASRVVLLGYSVPLADRSFSGMLTSSLKDNLQHERVVIEVVNPKGKDVVERLVHLGVPEGAIVLIGNEDRQCIAKWVDAECARLAFRVIERFRGDALHGDELLNVGGGKPAAVANVVPAGHEVVLELDRPAPGGHVSPPVRAATLSSYLRTDVRAVVVTDKGPRMPIVDFTVHRQPRPGTGLDTVHFLPAGQPST